MSRNCIMQQLKVKDLKTIKTKLIALQSNRCPICGQWFEEYPEKDIVIDHDHTTGVIRGAICRHCNRAEGKIRTWCVCAKRQLTALQWLVALTKYLWFHREPQTEWLHPTYKSPEEKQQIKREKARVYYARKKAVANLRAGTTRK